MHHVAGGSVQAAGSSASAHDQALSQDRAREQRDFDKAQLQHQRAMEADQSHMAFLQQQEQLKEKYQGFTFTAKAQARKDKIAQDRQTVMADVTLTPAEKDNAIRQLNALDMGIKPTQPPPPSPDQMLRQSLATDDQGRQWSQNPKTGAWTMVFDRESSVKQKAAAVAEVEATKQRQLEAKMAESHAVAAEKAKEAQDKLELSARAKAISIAQRANGTDMRDKIDGKDNPAYGKPIPPTDEQIQAVQDKLQPSRAKGLDLTPHQQAHRQGMADSGHPNPPPYFKTPDDPGFSDHPDGAPFVDGLGRTRIKNGGKQSAAPQPGPQDLNTVPDAGGLPMGDPRLDTQTSADDQNALQDDGDGSDGEDSTDTDPMQETP